VADWGGGMSMCCTVGPIVRCGGQWMAAYFATDHGIINSCQSAATSEIVKRCLKLKALFYFKAARMLFSGPLSTKYTSVSRCTSS